MKSKSFMFCCFGEIGAGGLLELVIRSFKLVLLGGAKD